MESEEDEESYAKLEKLTNNSKHPSKPPRRVGFVGEWNEFDAGVILLKASY